jgi:hypothetical protein
VSRLAHLSSRIDNARVSRGLVFHDPFSGRADIAFRDVDITVLRRTPIRRPISGAATDSQSDDIAFMERGEISLTGRAADFRQDKRVRAIYLGLDEDDA